MKIRSSRTALALLTLATLALPPAMANSTDAAKCAPKTQAAKCGGKCAPMGKCAGKCKPKCAPAK